MKGEQERLLWTTVVVLAAVHPASARHAAVAETAESRVWEKSEQTAEAMGPALCENEVTL